MKHMHVCSKTVWDDSASPQLVRHEPEPMLSRLHFDQSPVNVPSDITRLKQPRSLLFVDILPVLRKWLPDLALVDLIHPIH